MLSLAQRRTSTSPARVPVGSRRSRIILTVILIAGAMVTIFPFIWMILGSLKTMQEGMRFPPTFLPETWDWSNYKEAWQGPPGTLGRYLKNTVIIGVVGTGIQLFVCSLAAYAFAMLPIKGRETLFAVVLATMMVPGEITLIPNFVTIRSLPFLGGNDWLGQGGTGLYDTYAGIILPGVVGAFNIFMLRQAFLQIPKDLWEAAQIDGSGSWRYLWQIVLPLSLPALITVGIFGLVGRWNGLLWPLVITRGEDLRPIQLAMIYFQGEYTTDNGLIMAASVMATLPVVVIFLLMQKQFIEGIGSTGLKG